MTLSVAYYITSERRIILGSEIWVIHGNTLAPYFRRNCSQLTSVLEEMQATSPATIRSPPQLQSFPKSHPFRPFLLSVAMAAMTTAFVPASTLRVAPAARNHVEVQGSVEKLDLDCQWWHWFSNKTMSDMSDMCFLLFVHVHFAFSEVFFGMICNKSHGPGQYIHILWMGWTLDALPGSQQWRHRRPWISVHDCCAHATGSIWCRQEDPTISDLRLEHSWEWFWG